MNAPGCANSWEWSILTETSAVVGIHPHSPSQKNVTMLQTQKKIHTTVLRSHVHQRLTFPLQHIPDTGAWSNPAKARQSKTFLELEEFEKDSMRQKEHLKK